MRVQGCAALACAIGIGSYDPRLRVPPNGLRCFVVPPFDVLTLRRGHAVGGHQISIAYNFRREQSRVLPGENLSGNLVECLTRLLYRIAVAGSQPEAVLHLCRRVIGQFAKGRAGRGRLARLDRR
jgi:hypothetical protein